MWGLWRKFERDPGAPEAPVGIALMRAVREEHKFRRYDISQIAHAVATAIRHDDFDVWLTVSEVDLYTDQFLSTAGLDPASVKHDAVRAAMKCLPGIGYTKPRIKIDERFRLLRQRLARRGELPVRMHLFSFANFGFELDLPEIIDLRGRSPSRAGPGLDRTQVRPPGPRTGPRTGPKAGPGMALQLRQGAA